MNWGAGGHNSACHINYGSPEALQCPALRAFTQILMATLERSPQGACGSDEETEARLGEWLAQVE